MDEDDDYPSNDDLLRLPKWQDQARRDYAPIAQALIFPALLARFQKAEDIANRSKRWTHRRGMWAVYLVTAALLAASSAPFLNARFPDWSEPIAVVAAAAGLIGTLLALVNRYNRTWLQHRLVTESLRQLHFDLLITLAPDILEAGRTNNWSSFEARRAAALDQFEQDVAKRKADILDAIRKTPEIDHIGPIDPAPAASIFAQEPGPVFWRAYKKLRIERQQQYANHKLNNDGKLISSFPLVQARRLSQIAFFCVGLMLVLHFTAAFAPVAGHADFVDGASLAAIWTAIIALALRVVEEGLKPHAEVERYRNYQLVTRRILERFEHADDAGKLRNALALERASFDEMVGFLRTNAEARFVI